ncbi:proline--tRNA ligase, partial [archaeon]
EKIKVPQKELSAQVLNILNDMQKNLFDKASKFLKASITVVKSYEEFKKTIKDKGGFVKASWCGNAKCESKIKEETGATIRVIPFEKEKAGKCVYCGKAGKQVVYFAKAY